jgi:RNA polymerase sigma-70 factor (ECF subfamily)
MMTPHPAYDALSDAELAALARARDPAAVRLVTTRYNQRLFRAAWSILKNRAEAEEAVQDAYLRAFTGKAAFAGRASLATWLTQIVFNEALMRKRRAKARKRALDRADIAQIEEYREKYMSRNGGAPDEHLIRAEFAKTLEAAIARLPESFRAVLILRDVEGLSVEETAAALAVNAATIKTRHLRARRRLQKELAPHIGEALTETFRFAGFDCERLTARTLRALCEEETST